MLIHFQRPITPIFNLFLGRRSLEFFKDPWWYWQKSQYRWRKHAYLRYGILTAYIFLCKLSLWENKVNIFVHCAITFSHVHFAIFAYLVLTVDSKFQENCTGLKVQRFWRRQIGVFPQRTLRKKKKTKHKGEYQKNFDILRIDLLWRCFNLKKPHNYPSTIKSNFENEWSLFGSGMIFAHIYLSKSLTAKKM